MLQRGVEKAILIWDSFDVTPHVTMFSRSCPATYLGLPPQLPPVPEEVNMLRTIPQQVETRSQLVPNPGSPLSLESWSMAELDNWLTESASLLSKAAYKPISIDTSSLQQQYQQQQQKMAAYHNSVHVNIPSPSSGGLSAESPTMYDSPPKGYSMGPPPYVQVKQEIDDGDYPCGAMHMGSPMVKREEEEEAILDHQVEELRRMAVEQAAKDITVACDILGISSDPLMWSGTDANTWLLWILNQYNLSTDNLHHFLGMDGMTLCNLPDAFFRQKMPNGGDMLGAQLDIWKTAASLQRHGQLQQTQQPQTQQQQIGFRPEESMLDMSSILDQWTPYPSPQQRMSPPAGSGGGALPVAPDSSVASPVGSHDFSSDGMQSDDEISDESCDTERCSPAAAAGARPAGRPGSHSHIHLWQFLKELLCHPHLYGSCIRWLDRPKGIFKIEDSVRVARLWGKRKNRPAMNYDKLSRSIRQYYKKGIMKKTERSQRLVYQFCHPYGL